MSATEKEQKQKRGNVFGETEDRGGFKIYYT